jgi:DNA-binding transcriptional MerR regulator
MSQMAKPTMKQIEACRKMGMSDKEIAEMYEDDADIDKGEEMPWDLSAEEHKKAMKQANADEHKKPKTPAKRERKSNPTKAGIIAEIATFLIENSEFATENVEITNKERMIAFKIGDERYEITLIQKRKPKN